MGIKHEKIKKSLECRTGEDLGLDKMGNREICSGSFAGK